jgi:hypothetical protein
MRFETKLWTMGFLAAALGINAVEAVPLQLVRETKISALNVPALPHNQYEASGVVYQGGFLYVVFDNSYRILKVHPDTGWTSPSLTSVTSDGDSQYEAITFDAHNTQNFYAMVESAPSNGLNLGKLDKYTSQLSGPSGEWTNITFPVANKGFEGAAWLWSCPNGSAGNDYMLSLCEGNNCTNSSQTGNGKIKILQQVISGSTISWNLIQNGTVSIPATANFGDYSDIALYPPYPSTNDCPGLGGNGTGLYKVAIVSQESSQLWVGTFNAKTWSFQGNGTVYDFPKGQSGETVYCNVEGVTFLSSNQIAVASDAKKTDQSDACAAKDQSLHIFNIP